MDGKWSGVEVTELVHQPTLERSIKAVRQRKNGVEPKRGEAFFVWTREDLLTAIQSRLDEKDQKPAGPSVGADQSLPNDGQICHVMSGP